MKSQWTHLWKGFEIRPEGCLLEQVVDQSTPMGIAYERSCQFYKDFHTHDRPILIFPRESCRMEVRTKSPASKFLIDEATALLVPAEVVHDDNGRSAIYDTFALLPETELIVEAGKEDGLTERKITRAITSVRKLKRTRPLEQLLQLYFYERIVAQNPRSEGCRYLEKRILKETLSVLLSHSRSSIAEPPPHDGLAARTIKFIETNLFSELSSDTLARRLGSSRATLFRVFRDETGLTPYGYIKQRRLEEAMRLLKSGGRSVSEVALLVGYENFGAFSEAFKEKFKASPSSFLKGENTDRLS